MMYWSLTAVTINTRYYQYYSRYLIILHIVRRLNRRLSRDRVQRHYIDIVLVASFPLEQNIIVGDFHDRQ